MAKKAGRKQAASSPANAPKNQPPRKMFASASGPVVSNRKWLIEGADSK